MPARSTDSGYGLVARLIHWTSALMILTLATLGFIAADAGDATTKAQLLKVHVPLGIATLALTIIRIGWWCVADNKPPSVPMPVWQDRVARAVHVLFYIAVLSMAASGIGMMVLSDAATALFGTSGAPLPDFTAYAPRIPHGIGARVLLVLFVLHASAALYHHFFMKDKLLKRMWRGRT